MPSTFYLLTRFAAPDETVTIIDDAPGGKVVVRNGEGSEWVVQRSELSEVPAAELYRSLLARAEARFRIPVHAVRFAATG